MKIVIKSSDGQRYFKQSGGWTKEEPQAQVFKNTKTALKYCKENKLSSVQIVMIFDDGTTYVRALVTEAPEERVKKKPRKPIDDLLINYAA